MNCVIKYPKKIKNVNLNTAIIPVMMKFMNILIT